jgi:hypothetical protein
LLNVLDRRAVNAFIEDRAGLVFVAVEDSRRRESRSIGISDNGLFKELNDLGILLKLKQST